jgi:hypothetical protein
MKKILFGALTIFMIHSGALAAAGTCSSNKNRCDGHCSAQGGSRVNWCHADCQQRWNGCMSTGQWTYSDAKAKTGVINGVQKR